MSMKEAIHSQRRLVSDSVLNLTFMSIPGVALYVLDSFIFLRAGCFVYSIEDIANLEWS